MASSAYDLFFRFIADVTGFSGALDQPIRDAERLEREMDEAAEAARRLDNTEVKVDVRAQGLAAVKAELARLREQLANDLVVNLDADTSKAERAIRAFEAKVKALTPKKTTEEETKEVVTALGKIGLPIAQIAARSGIQFLSAFGRALTSQPEIAAVLAAVLVAAVDFALAAVAASIAAFAGFAAITAGIIGALQDPAIKAAADGVMEQIKGAFVVLTEPLQGPVLAAIKNLGAGVEAFFQQLQPAFAQLGSLIDLFSEKTREAMDILAPAVGRLIEAAGPTLTVIANKIPQITREIAKFFDMLSQQSAGLALTMRILLTLVELLIDSLTLGFFVVLTPITLFQAAMNAVSRLFDEAWDKGNRLAQVLSVIAVVINPLLLLAPLFRDTGNAAGDSANGLDDLGQANRDYAASQAEANAAADSARQKQEDLARATEESARVAKAESEELVRAFSRIFGEQEDFATTQLNATEGLLDLIERWKTSSKSLDAGTKEGINNRQSFLAQARSYLQLREAMVRAHAPTESANAVFDQGIESLREQAKAAGFAADEVDALLDVYDQIPALQITEIQTKYHNAENKEQYRAQLEEVFDKDFIAHILPEWKPLELEQKDIDRLFKKMDPEAWADEQVGGIAKAAADKTVDVPIQLEPTSFAALISKLDDLATKVIKPKVVPDYDLSAHNVTLAFLESLERTRSVRIIPYIAPEDIAAIKAALAQLGQVPVNPRGTFGQGQLPGSNSVTPRSPTVNVTPRIYLDGDSIRAAFRSDIRSSVERATVAAGSYRRL